MNEITKLLGWTELQYANFQYECGLEYLHLYILNDEVATAALERSRIFWNWWKNHWAQRDDQFMRRRNGWTSVSAQRYAYKRLHDPERLTKSIWPNAVVLHESFGLMIGLFNDEVKR